MRILGRLFESPLDELDQTALYKLLGEAWYAQFKPKSGEAYYLGSSAEMGKREYDTLVPVLIEGSSLPCIYGVVAWVTDALLRSGTWRMPASVVAALAVQQGLATRTFWHPPPENQIPNIKCHPIP